MDPNGFASKVGRIDIQRSSAKGAYAPSGLKGRNITPLQGWVSLIRGTRGDALRACPWLSYCAPLALHSPRFLACITPQYDFEQSPSELKKVDSNV